MTDANKQGGESNLAVVIPPVWAENTEIIMKE